MRTDIVQYLKQSRDFSIKRFQLNYYKQIAPSVFYKLAGGIFESMFGGYGGEILYRPYDKNYGIGFELWEAYQREYDQLTDFRDYRTVTGHLVYITKSQDRIFSLHLKAEDILLKILASHLSLVGYLNQA